jgi:hypothetical protein
MKLHHNYLVVFVHSARVCGWDLPYELAWCVETVGSSWVRWRVYRGRIDDSCWHCWNSSAPSCSSCRRCSPTVVIVVVMAMVVVLLLSRMQHDVVLPNAVLVPLSQFTANHSNSNHCSICANHFTSLSTRLRGRNLVMKFRTSKLWFNVLGTCSFKVFFTKKHLFQWDYNLV